MDVGCDRPSIDFTNPSEVTKLLSGKKIKLSLNGKLVERLASVIEKAEWAARKWIKFNEPRTRPDVCEK
jgi:hypothetical protein